MIRDFAVNTQFRRDIFVRGARHLEPMALDGGYRELRVALRRPLTDCAFEARLPVGAVSLDRTICEPILAELAKGPRSVAELAALPALAKVDPGTCVDRSTCCSACATWLRSARSKRRKPPSSGHGRSIRQ